MNAVTGVTTFVTGAVFDPDYIISFAMIAIGFVMMKKSKKKLFLNTGRVLFAVGFGLITWLVMWQITPRIMAEIVYGVRV